ncbi:hypothetical protein [Streptomyces sp. ERV7]|uniref:hypothetical protein n=1 Tax=Streptomyces sp. ERV7 TaxID=1322334 RepID=UPI000AB104A0|nr:hypothetical protein [Streptomyces sp. ERV7]
MRTDKFLAAAGCCAVLAAGAVVPAADAREAGGIPRLTDERGRTLTLRGWNLRTA